MKAKIINAGGQLSADEIIGRDSIIEEVWEILNHQCIYMNDLRRIGKTQIMVKMHYQPKNGWLVIKRDLEGIHSPSDLARIIFSDASNHLKTTDARLHKVFEFLKKLGGTEIAGTVKLPDGKDVPWKELLEMVFSSLDEEMEKLNQKAVFLWDEFPFMLQNISNRHGELLAMEILDMLRGMSQDYNRVRFMLTGSIGIHHVLTSLRKSGYNNSPLNRMRIIQPGPLSKNDATALAEDYIRSIPTPENLHDLAALIARLAGNVPFYIQKIISCLPHEKPLTETTIRAALEEQLRNDNSDWDIDHYLTRVNTYYPADKVMTLAVLDFLAKGKAQPFQKIAAHISQLMPLPSEEPLRDVLKNLCRDHYLVRNEQNEYNYYLEIIRRWWKINRSL